MDTLIDLVNKLNSYEKLTDEERFIVDEEICDIANDFLGLTIFLSKERERKAKNRARYKMKKYQVIKEFVMNQIQEWRDAYEEAQGGIDVMRIMARDMPHEYSYAADED